MDFLNYLIESSICLLLFYGLYYFVFRNNRHFQQNRIYLLVTAVSSLILPLLEIRLPNENVLFQELPNWSLGETIAKPLPTAIAETEATHLFTFQEVLLGLYLIVAILFMARIAFNLINVYRLYRSAQVIVKPDYHLVQSSKEIPIFSFYRYIFLSQEHRLATLDEAQIIAHERIHIEEGHTFDVLFFEVLKAVFWFHPAVYWYKKSIKETHEFIADKGVIKQGFSAYDYARLIIEQNYQKSALLMVSNSINEPPIKRRLNMIRKNRKHSGSRASFLWCLPLFGLLFVVFSCSKEVQSELNPRPYLMQGELPDDPKVGACYAKCKTKSTYSKSNIALPVYNGSEAIDGVEVVDLFVSDEETLDPNGTNIFSFETSPESIAVLKVVDTEKVRDYQVREYEVYTLNENNDTPEWVQVVCQDEMVPSLITQLREALQKDGYEFKEQDTGELNKELRGALFDYQIKNELPQANVNIETLMALEIPYRTADPKRFTTE